RARSLARASGDPARMARSDGWHAGGIRPSIARKRTDHHSSTLKRLTTLTAGAVMQGPEEQAAHLFEQTMQRALRDGRTLIVTHPLPHLLSASDVLARRFDLARISIDALLIGTMRETALQAGADWNIVLQADRAARDSADWRRLNALIARAMSGVRQTLHEDSRPLLVENIGLLVRYRQLGLIQSLRDAAQEAERPAR